MSRTRLPLVQTPQAERDAVRLIEWIAHDNPGAARAFAGALRRTYDSLSRFPRSGRPADFDHPAAADLRVCTVGRYRNYLVIYRAEQQRVVIVRVVHAARNLPSLRIETPS